MKKARKDSYFGLHFDFHAIPEMTNIGGDFNETGFLKMLDVVQPDYVQFDTKGHPGYTSCPNTLGNAAPGIQKNLLKIIRKHTQDRDIALLSHYSGVFDTFALQQHPEWAQVIDGKPSENYTSVFSPYVDEVLIPQIKELIDLYDIDGAWLDGECWACYPDYSEYAQSAFEKKTGARPTKETEEEYYAFLRNGFYDYVNHYVDEIRAYRKDFDITSNSIKGSCGPDPEDKVRLPYVSQDLTYVNTIYSGALLDARFFERTNLPWDIMLWAFRLDGKENHIDKPIEQLYQEAAHVLALGGGASLYIYANPTRIIEDENIISTANDLARFCRERQPLLQYAKPIKEVALLFSCRQYFAESKKRILTSREYYTEDFRGNLSALLDCQYHTRIVYLDEETDLSAYSAVVLTNVVSLTNEEKQRLCEYANQGGTLLVCGGKIAPLFADVFEKTDGKTEEQFFVLEYEGKRYNCKEELTLWTDKKYAVQYGYAAREDIGIEEKKIPLAFSKNFGKGRISLIPFDFGWAQLNASAPIQQDFYRSVLATPSMVEIKNTRLVHSVIVEKDGKLCISLINNAGPTQNEKPLVYDEVPAHYDVEVLIRLEKRPEKIYSLAQKAYIPFAYKNGAVTLRLPRLDIHEVLQIEF